MMLRRLALLSVVVAPLGVMWAACSVPGRSADRLDLTCREGCPESDASIDVATDTGPIGIDASLDASQRNSLCATSTEAKCTPDRDEALWTCGGSLIQQGASTRPDTPLTPQPLGDGSFGGSGGAAGAAPVLACQVISRPKGVSAECVVAGAAGEGEACQGDVIRSDGVLSSDCAPGLACVRAPGGTSADTVGQCRPYCCMGKQRCEVGTWCTPRPLLSSASPDAFVPVCAPGQNCTLLEPGSCPSGQACTLVADRTTTCSEPGKGLDGDGCSCAEGYVCLGTTSTCRQLCRLGAERGAPGGCTRGVCLSGGDALPPGYGLCVAD